jgi:hypothetical protein
MANKPINPTAFSHLLVFKILAWLFRGKFFVLSISIN